MTIFEPLFLVCVFALFVSLIRIAYLLVRRRPARQLAVRIFAAVGVYFAALLTASAFGSARIYQPGEPQCFDEWCLAIDYVEQQGDLLLVHCDVISKAHRVTQREYGVSLSLLDQQGRTYLPIAQFGTPIDSAVHAGQRFRTGRTLRPARDSSDYAIELHHAGPGPWIIADRESLFHRKNRMRLPAAKAASTQ